ncbi:MAG TPA: DUF3857 domain-containing protein [Blastocatellia bacterium]|nr:DUF3857 domain-containing protein [Blastocatellia bacterium]
MTMRRSISALLLALPFLFASQTARAGDDDWKPIDPEHLAMKTPVVERDADAEAIFWEVRVRDEREFHHYLRIKVFTERGKETQSKIDIPFYGEDKVTDIAGRTIKPDGTIIELNKDAIFERTVVKASGLKVKAKTFAMPGVEPGVIIEYRWRQVINEFWSNYTHLHFQRDIPVQMVKYYIRPRAGAGYLRWRTFKGEAPPFVKEKDGFYSAMMTNMPAFREEPRMPPELESRTWMLLYYSTNEPPDKFWLRFAQRIYEWSKEEMKVSDEVRAAAASIIGDASTPEQKLERLFQHCRVKIKNVHDDASGLSVEERNRVKENKSPSDTLKRGVGTSSDIAMLFASLANAAGFEARVAMLADRSAIFFDPSFANSYFMRTFAISVRVGNEWRFYDPASRYVPFGMLRWQKEGQQALISDPKDPVFAQTPLSPPNKSVMKRMATLRLGEDGTLEGDVRIEYTGHFGAEQKEFNDEDSAEVREQTLRDLVKERLSTAEISNIRVENVEDPLKIFVHAFHVKVPGYAQRTGKRLFLQPGFFHKGIGPLFPTSERRHPIYFHFPWMEEDRVTIELPQGYALDSADSPGSFAAESISKYDVRIGVTKDGRILEYRRSFFFGGASSVLFPTKNYSVLKSLFDEVHHRDNHTITLKQSAAAAPQD